MGIRFLVIAVLVVLLSGCATTGKPEYQVGWVDSYLMVTINGETGLVDAECLVDGDFQMLEEICPECTEKRAEKSEPEQEQKPIKQLTEGGI